MDSEGMLKQVEKTEFQFQDMNSETKRRSRTFLYIAACAANLFTFVCGIVCGWTSPILPKLRENHEGNLSHAISPEDESWIGSLMPLGATFGPLIVAITSDRLGRKKTILLSAIPMMAAFFMFAFAETIYFYYAGRFLSGLSVGAIFTIIPVYVAEIAEDDVRGSLGTFLQLFVVSGLMFSFAIGPYVSMKVFNLLSAVILIASMLAFFVYIPETPQFLLMKGKMKMAESALKKLRSGTSAQIASELMVLGESVRQSSGRSGFTELFKSANAVLALRYTFLLMLFQQFCGINVVLFYTQNIFAETGSSIPPEICTIIIGVVQIVASAITPLVIDKKGKRFLLITSATMSCVSEVALGLYFYLLGIGNDLRAVFWLPIVCLVTYIVFYSIGLGPIPWAIMGELFPSEVKAVAAMAIASSCWFMAFLLTKFFSNVSALIGIGGSFWVFACFCAIAVFQVYFQLPETTGKSLQEIQVILSRKH